MPWSQAASTDFSSWTISWACCHAPAAKSSTARASGSVPISVEFRRDRSGRKPGYTTPMSRLQKESPMSTMPRTEVPLANLDKVVQETLAYFEGPGRATNARVDRWQARDVLMHFIYFHDATAWGIQSVALGGPPWPVPADSDTVNEVCRRLHEHESLDELLAQVRQAPAPAVPGPRRGPPPRKPPLS